ncbi:alpha/beta fold hydrolase [Dactylosporangium matsuzakiense]|uniref:alpha/beta fold hydrolase n=1 Tax=Dactylosporangium matsuzakiense TaxID=53360 RepID=UPI0021C2FE87|nr:alpha/beta hydrolase [Dactylosporangium matsuzakiense]
MTTEFGVELGDGRLLHAYDTGGDGAVVYWHHGTPNIGEPPAPLFDAAERLGLRFLSHSRPGYGASTPAAGRSIADVAADVAAVADAAGVERFAVMGHSGGGAHALACAALLPERVVAAAGISGLAPFEPSTAEGFDWYAGMADGAADSLRAAREGRAAKERSLGAATGEEDIGFQAVDWEALETDWAWFDQIVPPALVMGPGGLIDDDVASAGAWGFDPAVISRPVLLVHGAIDRMVPASHSTWLAQRIPGAQLRIVPDAGHITAMRQGAAALEWLRGFLA